MLPILINCIHGYRFQSTYNIFPEPALALLLPLFFPCIIIRMRSGGAAVA